VTGCGARFGSVACTIDARGWHPAKLGRIVLRPYIVSIGSAGTVPAILFCTRAIGLRRHGGRRYQNRSVLVIEKDIGDLDVLRFRIDLEDLLIAQREEIVNRARTIRWNCRIWHRHSQFKKTLTTKFLLKEIAKNFNKEFAILLC
jgi:hypothetical protein